MTEINDFYEMILKARPQLEKLKQELKDVKHEPIIIVETLDVKQEENSDNESIGEAFSPASSEKTVKKRSKRSKKGVDKKTEEEDVKLSQFFKFSCPECPSIKFHTFPVLKLHMKEKHKVPRHVIFCCKLRLSKRCHLLEHFNYHENPDNFKCPECKRQFLSKVRVIAHLKYVHGPKNELSYQCKDCGKHCRSPSALKSHSLRHISKEAKDSMKKLICDHCGSKFITKSMMAQHMHQMHMQADRLVCDICAKIYKSKTQLMYHHRTTHQEKAEERAKCEICDKTFLNDYCMRVHYRSIHANKGPHICKYCQKVSPTRKALQYHIAYMHEVKKMFPCTYCDVAFKREVALKEHMATHLGIQLYECEFCQKTFNSKANMYAHRKSQHLGIGKQRRNLQPFLPFL